METINSRFEKVIRAKGMNYSSFARKVNVAPSVIKNICDSRNEPSWKVFEAFVTTNPDINLEWLVFGKGEMQKASEKENESEIIEILKKDREILSKNNESLLKDKEMLQNDKERLWNLIEAAGKKDNPTPEGTNVIKVDFLQKDEQLLA